MRCVFCGITGWTQRALEAHVHDRHGMVPAVTRHKVRVRANELLERFRRETR